MRLKNFLAGFLLIGTINWGWSQSSECEQTLNVAAEEFNAGHFYGIPSLLKSCIERNGFTNEQKVRAYLLLTQAYLIIDDPISAEDSYLKLLDADPEYVASNDKDPVDVVYLSKKFTSTAIFTPSLRLGANTSFYRSILDISTQPSPVTNKHVIKPGIQIGAALDWNITEKVALCIGGSFSTKAFKTVTHGISVDDQLTVTERQYGVDVPVYLKYADTKGKIRPYGYAGFSLSFLLSASATMEFINNSPTPGTQTNAPGPNVSLTYNRRLMNRGFVLGGGARYKIGKDFLFADLRYMGGLNNMVGVKGYMSDPKHPSATSANDALSYYRYVDSYFRLDNLSLSIGYIHPLYQPRKVKPRGTKQVAKDIQKQMRDESK
jgi:Outer membrane protein beta-barrel domain